MTRPVARFHSSVLFSEPVLAVRGYTIAFRCMCRYLSFEANQRACVTLVRSNDNGNDDEEWILGVVRSYDMKTGSMVMMVVDTSTAPVPLSAVPGQPASVDISGPRGPQGPNGPPGPTAHAPFYHVAYAGSMDLLPNVRQDVAFETILHEDVKGTFAVGAGGPRIVASAATYMGLRVSFKAMLPASSSGIAVVLLEMDSRPDNKAIPDSRATFAHCIAPQDLAVCHTFPLVRCFEPGDTLKLCAWHVPAIDTAEPMKLCDIYVYVES